MKAVGDKEEERGTPEPAASFSLDPLAISVLVTEADKSISNTHTHTL